MKRFKKSVLWIIIVLIAGASMVAYAIAVLKTDNTEAYFEGKALCVKIVDYGGANYTDEPRYNYHEINEFDNVTAPGVYTTNFSIIEVRKDLIVISFKEPLVQNGNEVSEIQLKPNEEIELNTSNGDKGTLYTFSIVDWSNVPG